MTAMAPTKPAKRKQQSGPKKLVATAATKSTNATTRKETKQQQKQQRRRRELQNLVVALLHFKQQEGHFVVPTRFEIPSWWPTETHALCNLAQKTQSLAKILHQGLVKDKEVLECLRFMEFPMQNWREYVWQTVTLPALETYKRLHGDLLVPTKFVVPDDDKQWPKPTWTMALGPKVDHLRQSRATLHEQELRDLENLGFVWNVSEWKWRNRFYPALKLYKERFGHVDVPFAFEIDDQDESWPQSLRGIKLGKILHHVRHDAMFSCVEGSRDQLKELGFDWDPLRTHWTQKVLPALETFKELNGHCDVLQKFVVPSESPWPQVTWGLKLGSIVRRIRGEGCFKEQIAKDQERWNRLEFDMSPKRASNRAKNKPNRPQGSTVDVHELKEGYKENKPPLESKRPRLRRRGKAVTANPA